MRLLSQHGNVDIPYEQARIEHRQEEVVAIIGDREYTMGKYTSMEKSYKAMEMLRDAFAGKYVFKNVDLDDSVFELLKEWKSKGVVVKTNDDTQDVQYINNAIFQFPQDEDVEV